MPNRIVFAALAAVIALGLAATPGEAARRLEEVLQGLNDVVMRLLGMVIQTAPVAVGCLLFTLTARLGYEVLVKLGAYVGVVVIALTVNAIGTNG